MAGWWENIECQQWERVQSGAVSRRFLNRLRRDIAWLATRQTAPEAAGSALTPIQIFLHDCKASNGAPLTPYYGLGDIDPKPKRRPAFMRFLKEALQEQAAAYKRWQLEIISPYFAETSDFAAHELFFQQCGVDKIRLYLPFNDEGEALCHRAYYDRIANTDGIEWANWSPAVGKHLEDKVPRFTHAKLYHFYNGVQSWAFVGSVNFTRRALWDNQEAGFFVQLPKGTRFLRVLDEAPERWCIEDQLSGNEEESARDMGPPDVQLSYDWKFSRLYAGLGTRHADSHATFQAGIWSPEGQNVIADMSISNAPAEIHVDVDVIENLLTTTGFVHVDGRWQSSQHRVDRFVVMVQQVNWTHKPMSVSALSAADIMQVYANLDLLARSELVGRLRQHKLHRQNWMSETLESPHADEHSRELFAEYAVLFHGFRNLRQILDEAYNNQKYALVDGYLSGQGVDGLPALLDALSDNTSALDDVFRYLTLLCLIQVYQHPPFAERAHVKHLLERSRQQIVELETSGNLTLINADPTRTRRFFHWFKTQFFREHVVPADEESHAAD